jgi:hypothetical protein
MVVNAVAFAKRIDNDIPLNFWSCNDIAFYPKENEANRKHKQFKLYLKEENECKKISR